MYSFILFSAIIKYRYLIVNNYCSHYNTHIFYGIETF